MLGNENTSQTLERVLRLSVPQALLLILLLLNFVSFPVPNIEYIRPNFALMGIFYWAVFRPTLIPPSFCFVIGLLTDFITGVIPGLNAMLFVVIRVLLTSQRRFLMGQPYIMAWLGFTFLCVLFYGLQWFLHGLSQMHWIGPLVLLPNILATICFYPPMSLLLILTHRIVPVETKPYS